MNLRREMLFWMLLLLATGFQCTVSAQQPWKPCGPDSIRGPLRNLIPQGYKGADFRPACQQHDDCYDTPHANKCLCDLDFEANLLASCRCSRRPRICRCIAKIMANSARRRGGNAFADAQRQAAAGASPRPAPNMVGD